MNLRPRKRLVKSLIVVALLIGGVLAFSGFNEVQAQKKSGKSGSINRFPINPPPRDVKKPAPHVSDPPRNQNPAVVHPAKVTPSGPKVEAAPPVAPIKAVKPVTPATPTTPIQVKVDALRGDRAGRCRTGPTPRTPIQVKVDAFAKAKSMDDFTLTGKVQVQADKTTLTGQAVFSTKNAEGATVHTKQYNLDVDYSTGNTAKLQAQFSKLVTQQRFLDGSGRVTNVIAGGLKAQTGKVAGYGKFGLLDTRDEGQIDQAKQFDFGLAYHPGKNVDLSLEAKLYGRDVSGNLVVAYRPGKNVDLSLEAKFGHDVSGNLGVVYRPGKNVDLLLGAKLERDETGSTTNWSVEIRVPARTSGLEPATSTDAILTDE